MIYYLVAKQNTITINSYIGGVEFGLLPKTKTIFYHQISKHLNKMRSGVLIFSDIEFLNELDRRRLSIVHQELERSNLKILNHPGNSMRRYELLNSLYNQGFNKFRVYRPSDDLDNVQFPVFLRFENDHSGNQSELILNKESLREKINMFESFNNKESIKSINRLVSPELLITEFCDTSDKEGIFRKYSAFYIDGRVIPRHLFFDVNWCIKKAAIDEDLFIQEELEYINSNPHQNEIISIFKIARIDFGRIDYSLKNEDIQVWEINTNPTILSRRMLNKKARRYETHQIFRGKFKKEMYQLYNTHTLNQDKVKGIYPYDILSLYKQLLMFIMIRFLASHVKWAIKMTNSTLLANIYANFKSLLNKPNI